MRNGAEVGTPWNGFFFPPGDDFVTPGAGGLGFAGLSFQFTVQRYVAPYPQVVSEPDAAPLAFAALLLLAAVRRKAAGGVYGSR